RRCVRRRRREEPVFSRRANLAADALLCVSGDHRPDRLARAPPVGGVAAGQGRGGQLCDATRRSTWRGLPGLPRVVQGACEAVNTMSFISAGAEWDFDLIERYERAIGTCAAAYGLDTYPNQIEIISSEQMLVACAGVGLPVGYPHWSYGKEFIRNE